LQYVRFWIRTCIVCCPLLFFLLFFGVHIAFWKAILATAITGVSGIVLMAPIGLIATRVDRSLWSEQAYRLRMERKQERLAKLQEAGEREEKA
jgi:arginine exporter protein ArgO